MKHLETFSKLFSQILKGKEWKKNIKSEKLEEESVLIERLKASGDFFLSLLD